MSLADKLKDPKTLKKALQLAQSLKKLDKNKTAGGSSTNSRTLGSLQKDVAKLKKGARKFKPGELATRNATVAGSSVVGSPVAGSRVVNVAPKKLKRKRRPIDGIAQTGLTRGRMV